MNNKRLIKTVVFGLMQATNKPKRLKREWLDNVKECGVT